MIQNNPLLRTVLLFGGVAVLIEWLTLFTLISLDFPLFEGLFNVDVFVPIPFVVVALIYFKNLNEEKSLRFWQGMLIAYPLCLLTAVGGMFFLQIYLSWIDPSYLTHSIDLKIAEYTSNMDVFKNIGIDKEMMYQIKRLPSTTPSIIGMDKFFKFSFVGIFYSIILAVLFRR